MSEVFHGGRLDDAIAQHGGERGEWLDLSTGINPIPYPVSAISREVWARLPDARAEQELLDAARTYYRVPQEFEIVAAPGTQAIIELLPRVLVSSNVSIVSPTYGEHENAWRKARFEPSNVDVPRGNGGTLVVVNPNNPTAKIWNHDVLRTAASSCEHLVVDEAFSDPVPVSSIVSCMQKNMIVLRSFGKFFGLAGVRLGFAICHSEVAGKLQSMIGPWGVSGPALEIGTKAFGDKEWISEAISRLQDDSEKVSNMLKRNGFMLEGVNPLFVSVRHEKARKVFEFLATEHILVRPFPDREGYLRFGLCQSPTEFDRLEQALKACAHV